MVSCTFAISMSSLKGLSSALILTEPHIFFFKNINKRGEGVIVAEDAI